MQLTDLSCYNKWITTRYLEPGEGTLPNQFSSAKGSAKALIPSKLITFILSKLRPPTA